MFDLWLGVRCSSPVTFKMVSIQVAMDFRVRYQAEGRKLSRKKSEVGKGHREDS